MGETARLCNSNSFPPRGGRSVWGESEGGQAPAFFFLIHAPCSAIRDMAITPSQPLRVSRSRPQITTTPVPGFRASILRISHVFRAGCADSGILSRGDQGPFVVEHQKR